MPATASQLRRTAKQLFRRCLVNGRLDEQRARFVIDQVLKSRRRGYFTLLSNFKRLIEFEDARHSARVHSATPLPADLQLHLKENLQRVYGETIRTEFAEDRDLIGGIRIQVSSDVYDGTVRSRLAALAASFGIPRA